MALQAPTAIRTTKSTPAGGIAGFRRPPPHRIALNSSFFSSSAHLLLHPPPKHSSSGTTAAAAPKITMRVASKQAYICRDCGYIYSDRTAFEKLPDKYFCPVCGAPKKRFRAYEPSVGKNANDTAVRKARKEQLKRDESIGRALPVVIGVGAAALAGLYLYLNNKF